jgi:hypothetical protein
MKLTGRRLPIAPLRSLVLLPILAALTGCHILKFSISKNEKDAAVRAADRSNSLPGKYSQRVSQFVFISDFELKSDQPIFKELTELRERIIRDLGLPVPTELVQVYLFEDRERYRRYMKGRYSDLPERRAFFVAQPKGSGGGDDLIVFTFLGDHLRQDLRHELTHALLHSALKDVPLWLDEGLAEYYELPPDARGVNPIHLAIYRREGIRPNLARLELLSQVQQMNQAEYREAWAWVHFMLHDKPESKLALTGYLKQLRFDAAPGPLQLRLENCYEDLEGALLAHLGKLK